MKNNNFEIKSGNKAEDMQFLSPKMFIVWGYFLSFASSKNLPVTITNIVHKFTVSTSNTHPDGRAIDVSIRNWTHEDIKECGEYMEQMVGIFGAISAKTKKPRVFFHHDIGLGAHIHLQVSHSIGRKDYE